jgi:hypothetical protein
MKDATVWGANNPAKQFKPPLGSNSCGALLPSNDCGGAGGVFGIVSYQRIPKLGYVLPKS